MQLLAQKKILRSILFVVAMMIGTVQFFCFGADERTREELCNRYVTPIKKCVVAGGKCIVDCGSAGIVEKVFDKNAGAVRGLVLGTGALLSGLAACYVAGGDSGIVAGAAGLGLAAGGASVVLLAKVIDNAVTESAYCIVGSLGPKCGHN